MTRQISQAGADTIVCGTAVVGSGAAGYSAALRLWQYGQRDILLLTENRMAGTSRNTGSDKQTYYKLTLSGDEPDSVGEMARTLFQGGCVDGDIALCEAALSALQRLGLDPDRKYHIYSKYLSYEAYGDELMQFGLMLEDQASGQIIEGSGGSGSCEDFRSLVYEVVGL